MPPPRFRAALEWVPPKWVPRKGVPWWALAVPGLLPGLQRQALQGGLKVGLQRQKSSSGVVSRCTRAPTRWALTSRARGAVRRRGVVASTCAEEEHTLDAAFDSAAAPLGGQVRENSSRLLLPERSCRWSSDAPMEK